MYVAQIAAVDELQPWASKPPHNPDNTSPVPAVARAVIAATAHHGLLFGEPDNAGESFEY